MKTSVLKTGRHVKTKVRDSPKGERARHRLASEPEDHGHLEGPMVSEGPVVSEGPGGSLGDAY